MQRRSLVRTPFGFQQGYEHIVCLATDPGLTSTGVNIQHQLTTSAGLGADKGLTSTNQLHDALGHHAADGALAMSLASIVRHAQRNDFYTSMRSTQVSENEGSVFVLLALGHQVHCFWFQLSLIPAITGCNGWQAHSSSRG